MHATKRRFESSVIQRLIETPHRFGFFQAVRLLELWLKRNGVAPSQALTGVLRFRNTLSLGFPASELESLVTDPVLPLDATALLDALQNGGLNQIVLTTTFMGFLGASGTLPSHYSEKIAAHQLFERDDGPRAFLDTFSGRPVTLFYQAWQKYRLEFKYECGGEDRFLPLLLSLAGLNHSSLHARLENTSEAEGAVLDESLGHFAAALRQRPMSAVYMQKVLHEYFKVPIELQQFVGAWYAVPRDQQTTLGGTNAVLGAIAIVGERVWQRNLRVSLRIGPLARTDYEPFLPGGRSAQALEKLVTMFTGVTLEYDVELVLRAGDVRGMHLGAAADGGRLGCDAMVVAGAEKQDRCDVRYRLHAIA